MQDCPGAGRRGRLLLRPAVLRIAAVRNMYKKLSFDPGRHRPVAEAFVRRVLQDRGIHKMNSAVDVNKIIPYYEGVYF